MDMVTDGDIRPAATRLGVAGVILAMALAAVGNGLMFAYIPVRLNGSGYDPTWAGLILTGLSAGGIAGCLLTAWLVRRVGHARAYMVFTAVIVLSNATVGAGIDPVVWIGARAMYGFAICGMFVVAQSWLNDAVDNSVRGRIMAIFYVAYMVGLGAGSSLMGLLDIDTVQAPLLGIVFAALSILSVGLTRLPQPPPPPGASVAIAEAWRISPVGLAGMLAVGGLSMMIGGFAPIHVTANGFTQQQVAMLMAAVPLGTLLFQIPFGWISDRTDRRYVLLAAALIVAVAGMAAFGLDGSALVILIPVYVVWSGASESIYSLASAHANDRATKEQMVRLSGTMLLVWSVSGFIVPGIGTALTAAFGTQSFMVVAVVIALGYAGFVVYRIGRTPAVPPEESAPFTPLSAQAPPPAPAPEEGDQPLPGR